jgi:hypothetical protein
VAQVVVALRLPMAQLVVLVQLARTAHTVEVLEATVGLPLLLAL